MPVRTRAEEPSCLAKLKLEEGGCAPVAMSNGIFFLRDNKLIEMREQPYDSEGILQELLERYPRLLAVDQAETSNGGWLLIRRELGVPGEESGGNRWSVDHLFVDRAAVPTLVEVKRSTDARLRREVVGQMLDYAANGVRYWPPGRLRSEFESRCARQGLDPTQVLADNLGSHMEPDRFWDEIEQNLRSGRVRMIFVADVIPVELRRVIEFLNDQLSQASVVGIEVRQYVGDGGSMILVPQAVGQTEQARIGKSAGSSPLPKAVTWDFYQQQLPPSNYEVARELFARIEHYVHEHDLPWTPILHPSYLMFQRPGQYGVVGMNLPRRQPVKFWIKLPGSLEELTAAGHNVANPYPSLEARWDGNNRQLEWAVPGIADVPDVGGAIDLCRQFQPPSGGMRSLR